ncbi:hypothetical protein [Bradyrhizobium genosp. P]
MSYDEEITADDAIHGGDGHSRRRHAATDDGLTDGQLSWIRLG